MRIGDIITITHVCAGNGFSYRPEQRVVVTEDNFDRLDSLVTGGFAGEVQPAGWRAMPQEEIDSRRRVLVFVPMAPRLEVETIESLTKQQGVEFFDLMFAHDNPHEWPGAERMKNIQANYEKMRRIALSEGYKKVWIVESDMIVQETALRDLLAVDADVVSGLYMMRHGDGAPNVFMSSGPVLRVEDMQDQWGQVIPMGGGCTGCLLVDTSVLRGFSFWTGEMHAPDAEFMAYCRSKPFRQMAHLGVVCGHKRPDGIVLWPDREQGIRRAA